MTTAQVATDANTAERANTSGEARSADEDRDLGRRRAFAEVLRGILVAAITGAGAGVLVGGIGGRIVMRIATLLNPGAVGFPTENGNRIGEITLEGTLAVVIFGGLFSGLIGSVVWVAVRQWLPRVGLRRAGIAGLLAAAIGGFGLVDSVNPDFLVLQSDLVIAGMFLGILFLFGFTLATAEGWVDRRVRHPGVDPTDFATAALGLVVLGSVVTLPGVVATMFSGDACLCSVAPIPLGVPLMIAGIATLIAWWQRIRNGSDPSTAVTILGRVAVVSAAVLGTSILTREIGHLPM